MPIYEYQCRTCANKFELLVLRGEVPACESCGGLELDRLLSLPNVKSESTKALGAAAARRRDVQQGKERVQEQIRYEKSHND